MVSNDNWCHRREVLQVEVGNFHVPQLFACFRIERDEIVIRSFHEEAISPHSQPAIADVCSALGCPEVMPQHVAIMSIDGPRIVRRRNVQNSVYLENGPLDRNSSKLAFP